MNTLIRKELRLLLPAWIAGALLALLPLVVIGYDPSKPWTIPCLVFYGLGALMLGIAAFGQEISSGTLGLYLVQPLTRKRLWQIKMRVLATAAVLLILAPCVACWLYAYGGMKQMSQENPVLLFNVLFSAAPVFVVALAGISGGLWTTLVFRQIAASFWIALMIPLTLILPLGWWLEHYQLEVYWSGAAMGILLVYSLIGLWLARRVFLNAQDTQWTGGTVSFSLHRRLLSAPLSMLPRAPWVSLVQKELQLQQMTILIAMALTAFHLVSILVRKYVPSTNEGALGSLSATFVVWVIVPLLVGGSAVAEERRMNTLEGMLCLPVSRRTQFFIKLGVVLVLGLLLGGILPAAMESLGDAWKVRSEIVGNAGGRLMFFGTVALCTTTLCFYASTLTRGLLQSLGTGIVIVFAGVILFQVLIKSELMAYFMGYSNASRLFMWIAIVGLGFTVCRLMYRNSMRLYADGAMWRGNCLSVALTMVAIMVLTSFVYWRTWEFVMPLEPRHGVAQLSGPVRPKIFMGNGMGYALLPDGRLWRAETFGTVTFHDSETKSNGVHQYAYRVPVIPKTGAFVGGVTWTEVAGTQTQLVGIESDGSLWSIVEDSREGYRAFIHTNRADYPLTASFAALEPVYTVPPATLKRIGVDSDWKSIVAGGRFFVALKQDGSLWGWGNNETEVLGRGLGQATNGPIRIGTDSDWVNVFASQSSCTGIKRDGSMWRWGHLRVGPQGEAEDRPRLSHPEPVRYPFVGTNWVSLYDHGEYLAALDANGTLWGLGFIPENLFKDSPYRKVSTPTVIGSESEWYAVEGPWTALKRDGTLWTEYPGCGRLRKASRYSDWIAVRPFFSQDLIALSADGTLCCWDCSYNESLLSTTRRPAWSLNILK